MKKLVKEFLNESEEQEVKRKQQNDGFEVGSGTIELDCAPGGIRPYHLFPFVIEGTNLTSEDFRIISASFGNFEFAISKEKEAEFDKNRETFKERVTKLYNNGSIRYGSW
jgi:hypothetical protein